MNKNIFLIIFLILIYGCSEQIQEVQLHGASLTPEQMIILEEAYEKIPDLSLEQMLEESDLVFEGTVTKLIKTQMEPTLGGEFAFSYWEVKVEDVIKGEVGTTHIIKMMGGTIGEIGFAASHAAHFAVGDHSIIFLKNFPDREGVTAGDMGKVDIS